MMSAGRSRPARVIDSGVDEPIEVRSHSDRSDRVRPVLDINFARCALLGEPMFG